MIGSVKPRGLCGSGLIALLAEMFTTGVIDKGGNLNTDLETDRVREGEHGLEYVVAWSSETSTDRDIVINAVDIDNLLRAKAAIYAGFTILADRVGVPLEGVEQVLIGGSFGKYINVENAVQIGLLPGYGLGSLPFPGQYLGARRVPRIGRPPRPGEHPGHRRPHDLYRAFGRQQLLRGFHISPVPAAHRFIPFPIRCPGDEQPDK